MKDEIHLSSICNVYIAIEIVITRMGRNEIEQTAGKKMGRRQKRRDNIHNKNTDNSGDNMFVSLKEEKEERAYRGNINTCA